MHDDHPDAFDDCDFATIEDLRAGISIGSRVLVFDENRRVYKKPPPGEYASGSSIHRGHFQRTIVTGQTSRSWVFNGGAKVSKKTLEGFYSNLCADRSSWMRENGYKIADAIRWTTYRTNPGAIDLFATVAKELGVDVPDLPGAEKDEKER